MSSSANNRPARGPGLAEIGLAAVVSVLVAAALGGTGLPRPTLRTPPPPPVYSTVETAP